MKKITMHFLKSATCLCALFLCACGPSVPKLHVYMWSDYIDEEIVKKFEGENACKVEITTFDSNEAMFSKLKAGGSGYDVILPSSYMAKLMYREKMIDTLDHSKLPAAQNIDKQFLKKLSLDKNMEYSIPYMLCYSCVAYNKDRVGETIPNTWAVFSDPKYKDRTTLLDDYRETIGVALKFNGFSLNTRNLEELEKAKQTLLDWKKYLARFDNEGYKTGIASGEFYVVNGYSGDLFQVMEESKNIAIMIPKEGLSLSVDDWVISSSSKNKDLAYAFINYMCDPENAAANMEITKFYAPIEGAGKYVSESTKDIVKVPTEVYENSEIIDDVGEFNAKYLEIWDKVKSTTN